MKAAAKILSFAGCFCVFLEIRWENKRIVRLFNTGVNPGKKFSPWSGHSFIAFKICLFWLLYLFFFSHYLTCFWKLRMMIFKHLERQNLIFICSSFQKVNQSEQSFAFIIVMSEMFWLKYFRIVKNKFLKEKGMQFFAYPTQEVWKVHFVVFSHLFYLLYKARKLLKWEV